MKRKTEKASAFFRLSSPLRAGMLAFREGISDSAVIADGIQAADSHDAIDDAGEDAHIPK